ncbi:type-F conjugative transfer system pilin assembly thiol-disulfide isomerase TrbB, partial [Salmonella enterica]|nr:type-F conjugative transfer system pilin assembly thiol-disulfide isomerase TrbB [Salmonella enterica]
MSLSKILLFMLLLVGAGVHASTREEIERLYNPHGMTAQSAQPQQKPP